MTEEGEEARGSTGKHWTMPGLLGSIKAFGRRVSNKAATAADRQLSNKFPPYSKQYTSTCKNQTRFPSDELSSLVVADEEEDEEEVDGDKVETVRLETSKREIC